MTKKINIGGVVIGGGYPIAIQSMTNTKTSDIDRTVLQIQNLALAGCHIARMAVTDQKDAQSIKTIKQKVKMPLVADIQFDYRLAIASIENGIDKIRINPGNIGNKEKVKAIIDSAKAHKVPIRVGVNSGSIEKELLREYGRTAQALAQSALKSVSLLESFGFYDIVVSVKSSEVKTMIDACRIINKSCQYPQHLGVTEAGLFESAIIKSAIGIGSLLIDNIGDTIRVSVTGDPVDEIKAAKLILRYSGKDKNFVEIVSCPTCARCNVDLYNLATQAQERLSHIAKPVKIAIMGCAVNGPGEAKGADFGITGGNGKGLIFEKGKLIKTVNENDLIDELVKKVEEFAQNL
ncbi:MAG TPA: flavodoxin-dependent (E)-4-hydroxy-3-methylbut-2-enyl-diphosphate synthase [Clostridiales bacterium]|jgi:(E)-4-hydroxy-3-methylbut-2-enyl-diphosphate synthase|nr:flavodoxin-dependent (E)-4-hydroxy-3-methylbut-2-enyl-diphosphate synthase [Clostridiales bacterium]